MLPFFIEKQRSEKIGKYVLDSTVCNCMSKFLATDSYHAQYDGSWFKMAGRSEVEMWQSTCNNRGEKKGYINSKNCTENKSYNL